MIKNISELEGSEIVFYTDRSGEIKIEVFFQGDSFWLTQKKMAELFNVNVRTISGHLRNIFASKELMENSVIRNFRITAADGKVYLTQYYNLDAIISVGYRVNSHQATQFRIWATKTLKEFVIKGFILDDERLKNGSRFGKDYFRELLDRIRAIRASERRIYQQITDIFAECSIDYDKNSEITRNFYAMVQNKFHYAITGKTAAEIIYDSANAEDPNMGLKTWKKSPEGRIYKYDIEVAKNYLDQSEIKRLERLTSGYFDYLERIVENQVTLMMENLAESIGKFLSFNEYEILDGKGKISRKEAVEKAHHEFEKFAPKQDKRLDSDFDKMTREVLDKGL
uniref:Uncharacterized conserved protein n=1 Tax=Candidatus Kentrum sp. LFY TaxID=2126342 RepID=A0A450WFW9_9GAMM|nr:MAG: Uncharacterized conserved protein [Candidatus Kentron sp. LFY]